MLKFHPLQPLEPCFRDAFTQGSAWSLKVPVKPGRLGCHLQESSCGLQAGRLTILPGHCGHLSCTGQMPKSKIFFPQNTEAESCDNLLLPSFYRVDKKIYCLPCGIICKGNVICFINHVIMLAMKLPAWLLHVVFKQISQHFTRSLSNTAMMLYIVKVRQNSPKRGFKSTLEYLRQLFCSRAFAAFCYLGFTTSIFSSAPQLKLLLRHGERPAWAWFLSLSISSTADTHPSQGVPCKQGDLAVHKQLQGCRDMFSRINPRANCQRYTERPAGSRRWQGTGTWNIFRSSGSKGDGIFCLPQSLMNPDPGISFDMVQVHCQIENTQKKITNTAGKSHG